MPRVPLNCAALNDRARLLFMAQNILRVFRQFTIDLLYDYQNFFKGFSFVGNGIPTSTKEGKKGITDLIEHLKNL